MPRFVSDPRSAALTPTRSHPAASPQQNFRRLPATDSVNALTCALIAQPTRMIADLATRDGHRVQHIMPNGSLSPHRASDWLTRDLD